MVVELHTVYVAKNNATVGSAISKSVYGDLLMSLESHLACRR